MTIDEQIKWLIAEAVVCIEDDCPFAASKYEEIASTLRRVIIEVGQYREALEIISQGYGVGKSADDYGEIARAALVSLGHEYE